MVHSDRTLVALLNKHFSSWLSTFCNSVSIPDFKLSPCSECCMLSSG